LLLAILAMPTLAAADDLSDGVLIMHCPPGFGGRYQPSGCEDYIQYERITTCEEQNVTVTDNNIFECFILAAWPEEKKLCAVEFGLGDYPPYTWIILDCGPCWCPWQACTEYPTLGWPGANAGVRVTWTGEPPSGNFVPVYWFKGYGYYSGTASLAPNPASGFIGTASCDDPSVDYAAVEWGALGILEPGVAVCPPGWAGLANDITRDEPRLTAPAPNPFRSITRLSYQVPGTGVVDIGIYDVCGRLVRTLLVDRMEAGQGQIEWDGRDDHGNRVRSGAYFPRMFVNGRMVSQRVVALE
jgi:hypothetical protein